ncbi:MAG: carboxypeptidase M32 [Candidatus Thorarchaeota archaeon]
MDIYEEYLERKKEIIILNTVRGLVNWDRETYMPPMGIQQRSEQLGLLSAHVHRMAISPEMGRLLDALEAKRDELTPEQRRNIYLGRREYDIAVKTPEKLEVEISKQTAISVETWKKAKASNDWRLFLPTLSKSVDLTRQRAEILSDVKGIPSLYDALLDEYERGLTSTQVSKVFAELRDHLVPLAKKCADAASDLETSFLDRVVPIDLQREVATDLASIVGYDTTSDKARGRIDEVEHPFTSGYYDDVRITVKYHEDDFSSMMYAILHEAGHAMYQQNLNPEWKYQPIGSAASYGIHESQSRFVENMIGRSTEFISFYLPRLNKLTSGRFSDIESSHFVKAMNLVTPSLIRIEADEVTYCLHIIIRFEMERDLFADKIKIDELPQVWNEKYEKYLGVEVPDDTQGVLQDTHWASGLMGYFPSYALGNVYDGLFLERLDKDLPDWRDRAAEGDVSAPINWMKTHVHNKSALYDPADLIEKVTGKKTTARPYLKYLEQKYSEIYGF